MPRGVYTRKPKVSTGLVIPIVRKTPVYFEPIKSVDFDKLVGLKASLYYQDDPYQFQLGDVLFEVQENKTDSHGSSSSGVHILSQNANRQLGYVDAVIIKRKLDNYFDGYTIESEVSGHVWLIFGTSYPSFEYPTFCFTFYYPITTPQKDLEEEIKSQIT